jgi:hypothetical protein
VHAVALQERGSPRPCLETRENPLDRSTLGAVPRNLPSAGYEPEADAVDVGQEPLPRCKPLPRRMKCSSRKRPRKAVTSFAIASAGREPFEPFLDAGEIAIETPDRGRIVKASSSNSPGRDRAAGARRRGPRRVGLAQRSACRLGRRTESGDGRAVQRTRMMRRRKFRPERGRLLGSGRLFVGGSDFLNAATQLSKLVEQAVLFKIARKTRSNGVYKFDR